MVKSQLLDCSEKDTNARGKSLRVLQATEPTMRRKPQKLEKPILAKDGANILLRFSRLITEESGPHEWHPYAQARAIIGEASCDG